MNANEVGAILRLRLEHDQNALRWDEKALRLSHDGLLHLGGRLTSDGWTLEELDAVPSYREVGAREGWAVASEQVAIHWVATWQRQDDEAAAKALELQRRRAAQLERQRAEEQKREQRARAEAWLSCGVPKQLRAEVAQLEDRGFFTTSEKRATALRQVLEHPWRDDDQSQTYLNLALLGPPGTGKSLLSAVWLHAQIAQGYGGRFIDARDLMRGLADSRSRGRVFAEVSQVDYLVIDDLVASAEECEPGPLAALVDVLNARSMAGDATAFTSNRRTDDLRGIFDKRSLSRLMHSALVLLIDGPDWRAPEVL